LRIRYIVNLVLLAVVMAWTLPSVTSGNPLPLLETWLRNAMPLALLALAAGVMISVDRIDISIGSGLTWLGGVLVFTTAGMGQPLAVALIAAAAISAAYYLAFWWFCGVHRANALLFGLAGSLLFGGAATTIFFALTAHGQSQLIGAAAERWAEARACWYVGFVLVVILLGLWRFRTLAGIKHLALGMNAHGARLAGVNANRYYLIAMALAATLVFLACLAQFVFVQRGGWSPQTGKGLELIAIALTVLGGTRLEGGEFDPPGTVLTVFTYTAFREAFFGQGLAQDRVAIAIGLALLLVILLRRPAAARARPA